jgi:hypothetical protein
MIHRDVHDAAVLLGAFHRAGGSSAQAAELVRREAPWLVKADAGATTQADLHGDFGVVLGGLVLAAGENGPGAYSVIAQQARRAAYNTPIFVGTNTVVAKITAAGAAFPAVPYEVVGSGLIPTKVGALVAVTNSAIETTQGAQGIVLDLAEAVSVAVDGTFLGIIADAADTVIVATTDPVADLRALLNATNLTGFGRLYFILSPSAANVLSTWHQGGELLFPDLGPQGGSLLNVPALVTSGAGDSAFLVDASGLVVGDDELHVSFSTSALVELNSEPAMNSGTPAAATGKVISMFQTDSTALIGRRSFAAMLRRASAAAVLTDVAWGVEETT